MVPPARFARPLLAMALSAALAGGLVACSGSSDDAGSTATTSTTAPATTTSTTAPAATSTTLPAPVGRPEAKDAALTLYDAWTKNDRVGAATVADPPAIDAVFAATPGPYELYRGCDTGEFDTGGCLFRDRSTNNTIQIDVERRNGNWVVSGAFFSPG
ncbi:MAG: hypothetical protein R2746_01600 [Acidimicrobiales bacterium]